MSLKHTTGAEATGPAFYKGREPYVEELKNKVDNSSENLVLILGPRRMGKTSVVKEYFERCNTDAEDPGIYIYIYLPKIESLIDFYQKSIEEIYKSLVENKGKNKFINFLTLNSKLKIGLDAIQKTISEVSVAGHGLKLQQPEEWKRYLSILDTLQKEFLNLLKEFQAKKIVLGFDEVPEAILYLLKNTRGPEEVEMWLEQFRRLRHNDEMKDVVKVILFGSVNMRLTLEKIGQSKVINDQYSIEIKPLDSKEGSELFWLLAETLGLKFDDVGTEKVNRFLKAMFGCSSPWAVQNFIDKLHKNRTDNLDTDLTTAYLSLFEISGGIRYFNERLGKYYSKEEAQNAKKFLEYIVKAHLDDGKESILDEELFNWAKTNGFAREQFKEVVDILLMDSMVARKGEGYHLPNTVEKYFWYNQLVGSCKLVY